MELTESQQILASYFSGQLALETAVAHFIALEQSSSPGPGFGIDLANLSPAERDKAEQLFGRIFWCKMTGADPTAVPPAPYFEMLEDIMKPFNQDGPTGPDPGAAD